MALKCLSPLAAGSPRLTPRLKTASNFDCSFKGLFFSRLCVSVCACVGMAVCGVQKRALYPIELEFQAVVGYPDVGAGT